MITKITEGIHIQVETFYQQNYSNPMRGEYMFAYKIIITNNNSFSVRLLNRHWNIYDSGKEMRQVDGEGVVGIQPVIAPGDYWEYVSGCSLQTEMGYMYGYYKFQSLNNKEDFRVDIPYFQLIYPGKYN